MTAGKLLKALRQEMGWTQKAMEKRLGVTPPTLCRIEQGKLEPSLESFRRAARVAYWDPRVYAGTMNAFMKFIFGN